MAYYTWCWLNKLQQPTLEAFRFMSDAKISVEVRDQLASWIKSQMLTPAYANDQKVSYELNAARFLNQLIKKLKRMGAKYSNDIKNELNKSACILLKLFSSNPVQLYQQLVMCFERQCITFPCKCISLDDMEVAEVFDELHRLQVVVHKNDIDNCNMIKEHDCLAYESNELQEMQGELAMMLNEEIRTHKTYQVALRQEKLNDRLDLYRSNRLALVNAFRHTILMAGQLQEKVLGTYLSQWKINQRFVAIGVAATIDTHLDTIQLWCEGLVGIIWNTKAQITQAINTQLDEGINLMEAPDLMTAMKDLTSLYETLIFNSFIVENQPPQIMRMRSRFSVAVRLLLGKTLNINGNRPQVTVSIISEMQAQGIHYTNKATNDAAGELMNNICCLDYDEVTKQLSARFNHLSLKKINRMSKQRNKNVMDEKFALLFQFSLTANQCDLVLPVWAISCPVVVVVHPSQNQQGCANIMWDNAFAKINRTPFHVPELVCWNWLVNALSLKFNRTSSHYFTADQMQFLFEKALLHNLPILAPNQQELTITWSQFCKESLPGREYSFWEWFYQTMKLTHDHLYTLWIDDRIIGFIQKKQAEKHLTNCPPGTFLLRFSDTVLGGITIAFVHEGNDGQHKILHIQPFTAKELSIHSLADRILDIDELSYLFPDIPKDVAFQRRKMKKNIHPNESNYVTTELRARLMLPSVRTTGNQPCNNQMPASSEYTSPDIDQLSFFDLDNITLFSQK